MGAVLCGGRSSRFQPSSPSELTGHLGPDKALAPFGGSTVGARVVRALRDGGVDPVVTIGGTAGASIGVPTVADRWPDAGPLAALTTALLWARSGWVLTAACDLPLLCGEVVATLVASRSAASSPVIATIDGQPDPSLGCWPSRHGIHLRRQLRQGRRALRAALDDTNWVGVEVPPSALADVDTPAELAAAIRYETVRCLASRASSVEPGSDRRPPTNG